MRVRDCAEKWAARGWACCAAHVSRERKAVVGLAVRSVSGEVTRVSENSLNDSKQRRRAAAGRAS